MQGKDDKNNESKLSNNLGFNFNNNNNNKIKKKQGQPIQNN